MAEAILKSYDDDLEILSAGIDPVDHVSDIAIEVMKEIGINLSQHQPRKYSEYQDMEFDYLITVGDGTNEELKIPPIKHKRKMHLGFHNPYEKSDDENEIREKCREIRDEIKTEMDYFYHHILKKQKKQRV